MKFSVIFIFLLFIMLIQIVPFYGGHEEVHVDAPELGIDGKYHIQIVVSQWQYSIFNLDFNASVLADDANEIAISGIDDSVGPFLTGKVIVFEVYSKDVQHGFSINELEIAVATIRPSPGETIGPVTVVETTLPSEAITFTAFCHIFCGLGHPDVNIDFVVVDAISDFPSSTDNPVSSSEAPAILSIGLFPLVFSVGMIIIIKRKFN